jgi:hypothetical protein
MIGDKSPFTLKILPAGGFERSGLISTVAQTGESFLSPKLPHGEHGG